MDGTLIDTEPYWMGAETELVEAHGGVWTHEDGLSLVGNPMLVSAGQLQERGVDLPLEDIVDFLNRRVAEGVAAGIPWQPGAAAGPRRPARRGRADGAGHLVVPHARGAVRRGGRRVRRRRQR